MSIFSVQRGATAKIEKHTAQSADLNLHNETRDLNNKLQHNNEGKQALINPISSLMHLLF